MLREWEEMWRGRPPAQLTVPVNSQSSAHGLGRKRPVEGDLSPMY